MNALDVMVTDVIAVRPQDTVRDAPAVLLERRVSAALVVDDNGRPPAPIAFERCQAFDRRAGDEHERDALFDVPRLAFLGGKERGAHWARWLALPPEHQSVGRERVVTAEQIRKADGTLFTHKAVLFSDRAAGRQCPAHLRHAWRQSGRGRQGSRPGSPRPFH